jgi:hypothetical protein
MTVGLLPSPDDLSSQTPIPDKQDTPVSSPIKLSSRTNQVGELVAFCIEHPEFFKFIFQCVLTLVILGFCIIQLANGGRDGQGKNDALYWGGITSILAWWMPSPGGGVPRNQANVTAGDINLGVPVATDNPPGDRNSPAVEQR